MKANEAKLLEFSNSKAICKGVSGIGGRNNGKMEVGLASFDELSSVMGLVQQSLETQPGNAADSG